MTAKHARILAALLAISATAYLSTVPIYASSTEVLSSSRVGATASGAAKRLLEVSPRAIIFLALPLILTAAPLTPRLGRYRRTTTAVAAVLLGTVALLGMMTVGFLYLPAALALVAAARLPERSSHAS
jgi:hypothetical protein